MVHHLFPNFLDDRSKYAIAEKHWITLWEQLDPVQITQSGWMHPWLNGQPDIQDGNPIFTAYTPRYCKGIRIIQYPPSSDEVEFQYWLDTFGGCPTDPGAIHELVISCALSEEASSRAFSLIETWVFGPISINHQPMRQTYSPVFEIVDSAMDMESLVA